MYTPHDGDIIATQWNDREMVKLVVKAHGYYSTVLGLYDKESFENEFEVYVGNGEGTLHADLGKIAYSRNADMESAVLIRPLDTKEYDRLLNRIGKVLGVPAACTSGNSGEEINILKDENIRLLNQLKALEDKQRAAMPVQESSGSICTESATSEQVKELQAEVASLRDQAENARLTAIKKEAERDVFEKLYKELLENRFNT